MRPRTTITTGILALVALLAPVAALADGGPPAIVVDLVAAQVGQDVKLTFGSSSNGSPSISRDETVVSAPGAGLAYTGSTVLPRCGREGSGQDLTCDGEPGLCVDCDDDGVPECTECWRIPTFEFTDDCVGPGSHVYTVQAHGNGSIDGGTMTTELTVVDDGYLACRGHGDTDAGSDPASEDGSGAGCSVTGLGSSGGQGALLALMLGIGLAALRARRE
jgi:hypothetical protein